MRKIISLVLMLVLCLSLCACGGVGGSENAKDALSIEESLVLGTWVTDHTKMDGRLINYTLTFFSDGSMTECYYDTAMDQQVKNVLKWSLSDNTITIESYFGSNTLTYSNENGIEKLSASQAEGYWYEHVIE